MTSAPVRDPLADHLITPQNAALLLIDYQPSQIAAVRSMDPELLLKNARGQTWRFSEGDNSTWTRVPESTVPVQLVRP